ncbi:MAG TPA: hypothetical protein PLZ16_09215 [Gammaproteobacteria bacterium]|nr:hypothetical protein [Gammaproteobacteria bacterium]
MRRTFAGELATFTGNKHNIRAWPIPDYRNSGAGAISLAIYRCATRIILLGFDMQHTGGKRHWHGNHPAGLANAGTVGQWHEHFEKLRNDRPDTDIVNASRETALTAFPCISLEEALNDRHESIISDSQKLTV